MDRIPVHNDWRTVVVVKDARAAARDYAEIFGINRWEVFDLGPDRLSNVTKDGRTVEHSLVMALGESPTIRFTLVQPAGGESIFSEFLATHGEGIAAVHTALVQRDEIDNLVDFMASEGVGVAASDTINGAESFYAFDTRQALGGYYIMVYVPKAQGGVADLPADEVLDFSGETLRPAGQEALVTPGCDHFGVVVHNLMEKIANYHRLFGESKWVGMNWRTEPGWLEDPTYLGKPVDHAYFTGTASVGTTGLCFEVIQPTFGPSHYKEDFRNIVGEGIHHMNLMPYESMDEYPVMEKWFKGIGIDMVMSGGLMHGMGDFWYFDTREKLHGYVSETTCIHPAPGQNFAVDWMYDFAAKA